nr:hypothetical protein [uncultured Bacteroides sp.]
MLPLTGITTTLISATLGHGTNDVGKLCTSNKINKWSKHKPVKGTTFKGANGDCGLSITSSNSIAGILNIISTGTTWSYDKPTGGATYPYRLGDFRNYNHTAESPITVDVPEIAYISAGSTQVSMFYTEDDYSINISDIDSIKNTYMGAYMVSTNGTTSARMITATSPILSGVTYVDIPISDISAGNYYIYPLLSDTVNTSTLSIPGGIIYYPLDSVTKSNITIKSTSSNIMIIINCSWLNDDHNTNEIIYTIEITNSGGSSTTLTNCYTFVKFFEHDIADNLVMGETQTSRGNITVPANSTYTINGSATAYYSDSPSGYNVWFTSLSPANEVFEYVFDSNI